MTDFASLLGGGGGGGGKAFGNSSAESSANLSRGDSGGSVSLIVLAVLIVGGLLAFAYLGRGK